ncbi:MAG: cyclic nucleotide-gated ion channel [Gammaproteobacteria bacterium]
MAHSIIRKINNLVSVEESENIENRIFSGVVILLIVINVAAVLMGSIETYRLRYERQFEWLRIVTLFFFGLEYLLRLWSCTEESSKLYRHPVSGRLRFLATPLMLIDLLVVVSLAVGFRTPVDFRLLRLFRLLNILQITRNSMALHILSAVVVRERRTLASFFLIIAVLLIVVSSIIFSIENRAQPDVFASIPDAMWWAMATLTTVGYGDVVPLTIPGKAFGVIVMFIGVGMYAIPTGILVSSFYQEMQRKDFLATWDLVAQVPFFSGLSAAEIAKIADLLKLHVARQGEVIIREGDIADCMYFIVSGEVKINKKGHVFHAKGGDFFGEIGVLFKTPRNATVTANTYVELLQLEARDVELFLEYNPELRQQILEQSDLRRVDD